QLRVVADANMVDLRIPGHQDYERHLGTGLRGSAGPSCPTRRRDDHETRDTSQALDEGLVPLTPSDDLHASIPNPAAACRPAGARAAASQRVARRARSTRRPCFAMHDTNWRISMH